ncbi:MAG TPA: cyclase family protein [Acidimicrobiales bacterium]|jgi:kynurenine formamidase|nr:cyclase family protein [Acidimicrobiales bacterium]
MARPDGEYRAWLDELAASRVGDRLGTAALIDGGARARAAAAARAGTPVSLARPLQQPGYEVEVTYTDGPIGMGADRVELDCHGRANTHLDALNHIALDGTWHGGFAVDDPAAPSVVDLAEHGLVTRGVLVDVPAVRGTAWAEADRPVGAADIEAALARTGTRFEHGDALLLYMGRDRFEAAGNELAGLREGGTVPGVGRTGAEWIADHGVSVLCWDFLDSNHPDEPFVPVHLLIWALGLILVDNCHLGAAAAAVANRSDPTGALVVAPLAVPGATGSMVRPLLLL